MNNGNNSINNKSVQKREQFTCKNAHENKQYQKVPPTPFSQPEPLLLRRESLSPTPRNDIRWY